MYRPAPAAIKNRIRMKNRRFTTKVASDGDENETTISVNNDHVELTLFRWYYRFLLRDSWCREQVGSRKEKVENVDGARR
jgi:hypothetical protein